MDERTIFPVYRERRSRFLLAVLLAMYLGLCYRAVTIQWRDSAFYIRQGNDRQLRSEQLDQPRMALLDRNGVLLAGTGTRSSVYLVVEEALFAPKKQTAALADALSISPEVLEQRISSSKEMLLLGRKQTDEMLARVTKAMPDAVVWHSAPVRFYPAAEAGAAVIGAVNSKGSGMSGAERVFEPLVRRKVEPLVVRKDRLGRVVEIERGELSPQSQTSADVRLTIELGMQILAHRVLTLLAERSSDLDACLVITDASNGEVLALDAVGKGQAEFMLAGAHAVSGRGFEPRFVMAPFVLLAGLEHQRFSAESAFPDANQALEAIALRRADSAQRVVTVRDMLRNRTGSGVAAAGMHLRPEQLRATLEAVGFGRSSGIGFEGEIEESAGEVDWRPPEQARVAFGRGMQVSLAQLAKAYGALAGAGNLYPLSMRLRPGGVAGQGVIGRANAVAVGQMMQGLAVPGGGEARFIGDAYQMTVARGGRYERRQLGIAVGSYVAGSKVLVASLYLDEVDGTAEGMLGKTKSAITQVFGAVRSMHTASTAARSGALP